jgi:hypothetical protein
MLHRQFRDALLTVDVAIPGEGESVASNVIILHEGRKASGGEIQIRFPKLLNLAADKRINTWLQHSDTGQGSADIQGLKPPGGINPPDGLPSEPPKRDPKQDPETPKDPKKDPEKDPKQPEGSEPDDEPQDVDSWETVLNAGFAQVIGVQAAAVERYLPLPVDIKKFIRAVVSVDKDAGNNTGLVTVSLVF